MPVRAKWFLLVGAGAIFAVAVLHAIIPFFGPGAYIYYGAARMAPLAEAGSPIPVIVTLLLALIFAACGVIGLSVAGVVRPIPRARGLLWLIAGVFALRGIAGLPQGWIIFRGGPIPPRFFVFSVVSLVIGAILLAGLFASRPARRNAGA